MSEREPTAPDSTRALSRKATVFAVVGTVALVISVLASIAGIMGWLAQLAGL